MKDGSSQPGNMRWLPFRNDSGEEAPPFACMMVTGSVLVTDQHVVTIDKPDGSATAYYFNGPRAIEDGKYGMCSVAAGPTWAAYNDSDTPSNGQLWGPVSGSWELSYASTGFLVIGDVITGERVLITEFPSGPLLGKTTTSHSKGASEDIALYSGSKGSETSTGQTIPSVYNRFDTLSSGVWVLIDRVGGGFEILQADNC